MRWGETLSRPRPGAHCASGGRPLRSQFALVASAAMPLVGTIDQNTAIQEQIFSATSLGFAPSQGDSPWRRPKRLSKSRPLPVFPTWWSRSPDRRECRRGQIPNRSPGSWFRCIKDKGATISVRILPGKSGVDESGRGRRRRRMLTRCPLTSRPRGRIQCPISPMRNAGASCSAPESARPGWRRRGTRVDRGRAGADNPRATSARRVERRERWGSRPAK